MLTLDDVVIDATLFVLMLGIVNASAQCADLFIRAGVSV